MATNSEFALPAFCLRAGICTEGAALSKRKGWQTQQDFKPGYKHLQSCCKEIFHDEFLCFVCLGNRRHYLLAKTDVLHE